MNLITKIIWSLFITAGAHCVIDAKAYAYYDMYDDEYDDNYCDDDICSCAEQKDYDTYVEYYDDNYPIHWRHHGCYTTYGYPEDYGYPEYVDYYPPYYRHYPYYIGHRYGPFFGIGLGF